MRLIRHLRAELDRRRGTRAARGPPPDRGADRQPGRAAGGVRRRRGPGGAGPAHPPVRGRHLGRHLLRGDRRPVQHASRRPGRRSPPSAGCSACPTRTTTWPPASPARTCRPGCRGRMVILPGALQAQVGRPDPVRGRGGGRGGRASIRAPRRRRSGSACCPPRCRSTSSPPPALAGEPWRLPLGIRESDLRHRRAAALRGRARAAWPARPAAARARALRSLAAAPAAAASALAGYRRAALAAARLPGLDDTPRPPALRRDAGPAAHRRGPGGAAHRRRRGASTTRTAPSPA